MRAFCQVLLTSLLCASLTQAEEAGRIEGNVTGRDGKALRGVLVEVEGTSASTWTDARGRFSLRRVPVGVHELRFSWRKRSASRPEVEVRPGATTAIDQSVDWDPGWIETVTVKAASRVEQPLLDAPAAVTTITDAEIGRRASHGSVPKLFEFTPGVDVTQYSAGGYFINTRGFNGNLTRRVAVLQDGRDLTDPFIGAMEWWIVANPLDDLSSVELVRGPTSALYGANATGGLVNLTTKAPRDSQGGMVRLVAGERDSTNLDLRWAGGLGRGWYSKVVAGVRRTEGYQVSRLTGTEYAVPCSGPPPGLECLPLDGRPLPEDEIRIRSGALRFDKHLARDGRLSFEAGTTSYGGPVFINTGGRGQINDVERPWGRFAFSTPHWNVLAAYNEREITATNLNSGNPFVLDADNLKLELETNRSFAGNRVRLVAGASYLEERIDANILPSPGTTEEKAVFAQLDWDVGSRVTLIGAARWDDSTLHDARVSPRASLVYRATPEHTLRLTYNEAFQVPSYPELFVIFPLGFTTDLDALNDICSQPPYGIDCGLTASTRNVLFGNRKLEVEEVTTLELGYRGMWGNKAFVSVELYGSENENFVTNPVPQVMGGWPTNPGIGPWVGPAAAESTPIAPADCPAGGFGGGTVADCVRAAAPETLAPGGTGSQLTNLGTEPVIAFLTNTNFGRVDTRGADLGLRYFLDDAWSLHFGYSWFDFDVREVGRGGNPDLLLPNAPEHRASFGVSRVVDRWNASLRGRWVDDFFWVNGTHGGTVASFTTIDLGASYAVDTSWTVGLDVENLLDDEHWEAWGGDLTRRRALAHVTFTW